MSDQDTISAKYTGRLARLRELVEREEVDDWGRSHIEHLLEPAPGELRRCPRFAGIISESGDKMLLAEPTLLQLGQTMANELDGETPKAPLEAIDLDTGQRYDARPHCSVRFVALTAQGSPADQGPGAKHNGRPADPSRVRYLIVFDAAPAGCGLDATGGTGGEATEHSACANLAAELQALVDADGEMVGWFSVIACERRENQADGPTAARTDQATLRRQVADMLTPAASQRTGA